MMSNAFNKWINTGTISENDIIPLMLEYADIKQKSITPQECMTFLQTIISIGIISIQAFVNNLLQEIAKEGNGTLVGVYDKNGKLIRNYWYDD